MSVLLCRHTYTFFSELNLKLYADIRFQSCNVISRPRVSPEKVCRRLKWLKFGQLTFEAGIRVKSTQNDNICRQNCPLDF